MPAVTTLRQSDTIRLFRADFMGEFGAPELDQRATLHAIFCFILSIAPLIFQLPIWMILFLVGSVAYRWYMLLYRRPPIPRLFFNFAVIGILLTTFTAYGMLWGRDAGGVFLCGFYGLKLLETHNRKDYYVLITFSYFLTMLSLLISQSIFACLLALIQFIMVSYFLAQAHVSPIRSKSKVAYLLLKMFGLSLPLVFILYIFFPRIKTPIGISLFDAKTGFTDEVNPGSISQVTPDYRIAFRVSFPDGAIPPQNHRYWRGAVLWQTTDGMSWIRGDDADDHGHQIQSISRYDLEKIKQPYDSVYRQEILLMPHYKRWLMTLDYPIAVSDDAENYVGGVVANFDKVRKKMRYEVVSSTYYKPYEMTRKVAAKALELPV
ncbi:MAG: DUF3488 domain-containing protein, partial [Verrucomicrobiota bacterium]